MTSLLPYCLLIGMIASLGAVGAADSAEGAEPEGRMLSHDVFFTLKDDSPEARRQLVAGCEKYLTGHPGTVWFAAGVLAEEYQREVNDRDFHVALHIVFKDKAAHDKYQDDPRHKQFIAEFKENWKNVRVFDSWVDASAGPNASQ